MNEFELRAIIKKIAEMDVELTRKGGPTRAGRLFDKLIFKQKEVLEHYKLPDNPFYQGLLQFEAIPWDNEIDELIALMEKESAIQRQKSKKSPEKLLIEAKDSKRSAMFILPELGIRTHVYTEFVYNKIFLQDLGNAESVVEELIFVNNENNLLNELGIMSSSGSDWLENAESTIAALEARGLKYIRHFAMDIINYLKGFGFKVNGF